MYVCDQSSGECVYVPFRLNLDGVRVDINSDQVVEFVNAVQYADDELLNTEDNDDD
jgi:hypothetical protein